MTDRLRLIAGVALVTSGLVGVGVGTGAYVQSWYAAWLFSHSGEAERMQRQTAQLQTRPFWVDEPSSQPTPDGGGYGPPLPLGDLDPNETRGGEGGQSASPTAEAEAPQPRASAAEIELGNVEFRFLDPPEAGAHALVALELTNHADVPSGPLSLTIPATWFDGYQVIGAIPDVLDDRVAPDGARRFDFPGLAGGTSKGVELHLAATDDDVSPPDVRVTLGDDEIGRAQPQTVAPRPRPGLARAISIPNLGIQAGVVPTAWEPPPFVVGQLRGSANLSEGNSVLIGHLRGLSGDVFAHLDRLRPGDEVVAVSRGLDYHFVVSETSVRPEDDLEPTQKTDTPRLTMMTCTGTWNPITQDYSHRLWVVAEPPELAEATIAANAEREAQANAEREARANAEREARAAAEAAAAPPTPEPAAVPEPAVALPPPATAEPQLTLPAPVSAVQAIPAATATRTVAPPSPTPVRRLPSAGLAIQTMSLDSRVARRLLVKGTRASPMDPGLHVWLFARPEVDGGRWTPYPREIVPRPDGTWEAQLDLGGPPNVRQELHVGVVDAETQAVLLRYVADHPNEPLGDLPNSFSDEVAIVVTRTR